LPPSRDSFGLALNALRSRLRLGLDAPGASLPINLIAEHLRLSTTPVREALSRLAGEALVEKRGPAYTRPLLDGLTLAELYGLRALHLTAALAVGEARREGRRRWASRPPVDLATELARDDADPALVVETLFLEVMLSADDLILVQAYQNTAERLAPFRAVEARLVPDLRAEARDLVGAFVAGERRALRLQARRHHRRRIELAPAIARLSLGEEYRSNIV
jgi:DNA-binding GntR family transcriptional regulator